MCAARRTTSTRITRLAAKASPYHSTVTLYDFDLEAPEPGSSRERSRRSTRRVTQEKASTEPDVEFGTSDGAQKLKRALKGKQASHVKPEPDVEDAGVELGNDDQDTSPPERKPKPTRKSKSNLKALAVPHPAPSDWEDVYASIKSMRARIVAPVDTMGCDQAQLGEREPKNQRFATLVSLMLSSQTKDEVTDAAVAKLRVALGGAISVQAMLNADEVVISDAIAKVGFWRRKTQYIKQTAQRLHDDFDADVPKTIEDLCSLPGVGPKMAFLTLQVAWNLNIGIGVDVHVHRITNRLGWHVRPTKNPEETRLNLESWLPKELHGEINHLLVGFGQTVCLPVGPKCGECTLSEVGLCPSAQIVGNKSKARKPAGKGSVTPKVEIEMEMQTG